MPASDWQDDRSDELHDQHDDEWDDHDYPDETDWADDDSVETLPCPECGVEVNEDSPRCPACGSYITHDTSAWSGRPIWWIVLGLIGIVAVIVAFSRL